MQPPVDSPANTADEPTRRERVRRDAVEGIPRWYSPTGHLAATSCVGLGVVGYALSRLHHLHATQLMTVALTFVLANAVEWRAHKRLLHARVVPLQVLYDRHTPLHHGIYGYDDMALRSWREARLVLLPAVGTAAIVATAAPVAYLVGRLFGSNAGWLALATTAAYVLLYEWAHLAYHLPLDHPIGRLRFVALLREHHRRHHHPRLMQRWNFNVTVPLFDRVMGTTVSDAELLEAIEREAGRSA